MTFKRMEYIMEKARLWLLTLSVAGLSVSALIYTGSALISVAEAKPPVAAPIGEAPKPYSSADGSVNCYYLAGPHLSSLPNLVQQEFAAGRTEWVSMPSRGLGCFVSSQHEH